MTGGGDVAGRAGRGGAADRGIGGLGTQEMVLSTMMAGRVVHIVSIFKGEVMAWIRQVVCMCV